MEEPEGGGGCTCTVTCAAQVILPRAGPPHRKTVLVCQPIILHRVGKEGDQREGEGDHMEGN